MIRIQYSQIHTPKVSIGDTKYPTKPKPKRTMHGILKKATTGLFLRPDRHARAQPLCNIGQ